MPIIKQENSSFTQADGAIEIPTPSSDSPSQQVAFATDSTAGTVAVTAKYHFASDAVIVYEEDGTTPLVIDLTDIKPFQLYDKWVHSFIFTPTGVDVSYTPCLSSGIFFRAQN
jgi:hypothetical protein